MRKTFAAVGKVKTGSGAFADGTRLLIPADSFVGVLR